MTTRLEKPVRRLVRIRRGLAAGDYVVTLSPLGIELREKGRRFTMTVPWPDALARAESLSGAAAHREQLRSKVIRRISHASRVRS